jgi:hypothetical protein
MGAEVGTAINSKKNNLKSDFSKISYDALFNENYFKINSKENNLILNLELSYSKVKNPFTNVTEFFLGLLIKSKYDGEEINESIDISIALDISNSMKSKINTNSNSNNISKIELAKNALTKLVYNLKNEDNFSLITFNEEINKIFPLSSKKELINSLDLIKEIKCDGISKLENGIDGAIENLKESKNKNKRIIIISDMNYKENNKLIEIYKKSVYEYNIPITIIAISNECNIKLIHDLSINKNCNYFIVYKNEDLEFYLVNIFKYICYPIAYDFFLEFESKNMIIEKCFGSGYDFLVKEENAPPIVMNNNNNNEINDKSFCKISSCFPSYLDIKNQNFYQRGGMILLKVKPKLNNDTPNGIINNISNYSKYDIQINLIYSGRENEKYFQNYQHTFNIENENFDKFSDCNIENAVSLYYFGFIIDKFISDENNNKKDNIDYCTINNKNNIENFINFHYKNLFTNNLKQEYLKLLDEIINNIDLKQFSHQNINFHYIPYSYFENDIKKDTIILKEENENKEEAPSVIKKKQKKKIKK